jgi:hypothetical protein
MPKGRAIKSKKQWRWLFANLPKKKARKMAHETKKKFKSLPTRVRKLKYRKLSAFNIITLFSSEDGDDDDDADEVGPPVDTTGETEDIPIGG